MEEKVMLAVTEIIKELDKLPLMQELDVIKQEIKKDKTLITQLQTFHQNPYDQQQKEKIYQNSTFSRYKQLENELYYLILEINQMLASLTGTKGCQK